MGDGVSLSAFVFQVRVCFWVSRVLSVEALDAGLILFSLVLVNFVSYGGESIGVLDPGHYGIHKSNFERGTIFIREHTRDTLSPDFSFDLSRRA